MLYSKWPLSVIGLIGILALAGCNKADNKSLQGYVEGEYLYLAAPSAGYLGTLDVERGQHVIAGARLFSIDADPELHGLREAEARVMSSLEKAQNLKEPRRAPEIAAMQAELKSAEASLKFSELQLQRQIKLAVKGFVPKSSLDEARAARDKDAALVDEKRQQVQVYKINLGRQPEVNSAEADVAAAGAQVAQKRWQVEKKSVTAPDTGDITETYYRPGEWVPAGQAVASLLPDDRRRIRFFVPEPRLAEIHLGQTITAYCDGCKTAIKANIHFIAPQAEYTPPVIYSQSTREKLVFRVEAYPEPKQDALHPGLPMTIHLTGQ